MQETTTCALFVDFDNIYLGLDGAERASFASRPARWLERLSEGLDLPGPEALHHVSRRILLRKCYLNPQSFGRYRSELMCAGFQVVDCPPLTRGLKTSADIYMALDIVDALNHSTRFDEFILMSADSDFTPVLLRLRAHDRRTAVVTVGYASPAYRAAADVVIEEAELIEKYLEVPTIPKQEERPAKEVPSKLLAQLGHRVYEAVKDREEVAATDLPSIYKESAEFRSSDDWLGYGSLRALTTAIASQNDRLVLVEGDPWRVVLAGAVQAAPETGAGPGASPPDTSVLLPLLKAEISRLVAESTEPEPLPRLAGSLHSWLRDRGVDDWAQVGYASFGSLIRALAPGLGLSISMTGAGWIYDPARHSSEGLAALVPDPLSTLPSAFGDTVRRISAITGAPEWHPRGYEIVFRCIADEVSRNGYQLTRTSKAVRDRCIEMCAELPEADRPQISRADVNFVLHGLWHSGYRFKESETSPEVLSQIFRDNILSLCSATLLTLTDEERAHVDAWILQEIAD